MSEGAAFTVSADWLEQRLDQPGLSIVDASWYLPAQNRNARAEHDASHIPGAVFFDHDLIADTSSPLPHTMPSAPVFAQFAGSMGISREDTIVVYDGPGLMSAPRAWWMFRVMGARNVLLLDGGFDRWKAAGRPVTAEPTKIAPCVFHAELGRSKLAKLDDVKRIVDSGEAQIADARPAGRFLGEQAEPRPGLRSGHMPRARNVPSASLSRDGALLAPEELRDHLQASGLDLTKPVVTTCGSGITAAVITLALETLGHPDHRLYDGSWAEWGGRTDTPVATGAEGA